MPITANLDIPNNFTDIKQQILERDIATVTYGSKTPMEVGLIPKRVGEIFFQLPETTPDRALRMWVSVLTYGSTAGAGITYEWHEIIANGAADDDYARVTQVNDFHEKEQTIQGRQIITWIDGGDQNPGDSGNRPEFDGQLYAAVKDVTGPDGVVRPDLAVWMARGNTWLPMVNESIDVSKLAKLDGPNVFTDTVQMIGPAEDGRLIGGTRIKRDGAAPIADPAWLAKIEGEQTIWFNSKAEGGMQVTIWTAVSTTGTQINDWKLTWSSKAGTIDPDNIAHLDQSNFFELPQRIGTGANAAYVVSSRRGPWNPHEAGHPDIMPFCVGDIYIEDWDEAGIAESRIWMATVASDAGSWHCVYDSTSSDSALKAKIVLLDERQDVHERRLEAVVADLGELDDKLVDTTAALGEHLDDYHLLSGLVDNLNTVSGQHEGRIAALETGMTPELEGLADRVTNTELSIANQQEQLDVHRTDININVDEIARVKGRVATLEAASPPGESLAAKVAENAANIEDNNRDLGTHKILIDQHDREIERLKDSIGTGGGGGEHPDVTELQEQVNTLEINVRSNSSDITDNRNSIITISNEVDGVTTTANDALIKAEQAKAAVDLIQDTVHANTNDITAIRTDVNGAVIDSAEAKENATQAKTDAATASTKADNALTAANSVVDDITTVNNTLTDHGGNITGLLTDMTNVENDVAAVTAKVDKNVTDITAVKVEADKVPGIITDLNATDERINDAMLRLTTAEADINTVEADLTGIKGELDDTVDVLTGLSANMDTVTTRVTANEAGIAATDTLVEGHTGLIGDHTDKIFSNTTRILALEQGSYNESKIHTTAIPVEDLHKHEILIFNHPEAMDNILPIVDDIIDNEVVGIRNGKIASGHFFPVFNLSASIVNFKTLGYRSKILDMRDMTVHNEFAMPTGAGSLTTGQLPDGSYGYYYIPMAAPAAPDPDLPPDVAALEGRVTILEAFQTDTEATIGQFPAVKTPHKYLVVNEEGTGYKLSTESVEDVQALAVFAEGARTGNALLSVKSLGADIGPVYTETVTIEQFCQSNYISVSPVAGEIFYTYLGNIVPFNSTTLGANEVREGMLYYVANKGSGTTRLNAPSGHNIFTSTQAATSFDVRGETAVILMPSIYVKAGVTKKMWTTIGVFHTNVKAGGSTYDDTEVRELIETNETAIGVNTAGLVTANEAIASNTADIATNTAGLVTVNTLVADNTADITTNANSITTTQEGIVAMGNEWTEKFTEVETNVATNTAGIATNTAGLVTANAAIATNTAAIATNVTGLNDVNAAIVTLTGRVDTAHENAANAIGTANAVSTRMNTAESDITEAESSITILQNSLTATGGDITGLRDRIEPLETSMITVKGQITGLDTRVEAIEALPEHPGLPPMEGNEGKYLCINDEGTAYAASTLTNTQALGLAAFGEGCQTGNSLVNLKCQGADTALTSAEITQTYFSTGNVVMGTPAGPASNVVVCNMGVIQPFTATTLAATDVREGCIITVANLGVGTMRLTPPAGCKIKSGTNENWETYDVKPGRTVTLFPAIYDSRAKKYIVLSNVGNAWAE